jgi:hypothetical protein
MIAHCALYLNVDVVSLEPGLGVEIGPYLQHSNVYGP